MTVILRMESIYANVGTKILVFELRIQAICGEVDAEEIVQCPGLYNGFHEAWNEGETLPQ